MNQTEVAASRTNHLTHDQVVSVMDPRGLAAFLSVAFLSANAGKVGPRERRVAS